MASNGLPELFSELAHYIRITDILNLLKEFAEIQRSVDFEVGNFEEQSQHHYQLLKEYGLFSGDDSNWFHVSVYVALYCLMQPMGYDEAASLSCDLSGMPDQFRDEQLFDMVNQLLTDLNPVQNTEPVHFFFQ